MKKISEKKFGKKYKYYDSIALGYDELHEKEQNDKFIAILNELNQLGLKKESELLDIGCGTCKSFDFFPCKVYGSEPSIKMTKQHPRYKELLQKKKLKICGAEEIKKCFGQKKFDFIITVTAAHHFENKNKTFSDIRKKLKKPGYVAFSLLKGTEKELSKVIKQEFKIMKEILPNEAQKDTILICKPITQTLRSNTPLHSQRIMQ